jgi:hypothetical protein
MKMIEIIPDSTIVNHAPWGTFVRAEDMYTASRVPKKRKNAMTRIMFQRQMMIATMVTRTVDIKVTTMTQTPYAFPRRVVYRALVFRSSRAPDITHVTVYGCNNDTSNHEQPIRKRHIDLIVKAFGGVDRLDMWEV